LFALDIGERVVYYYRKETRLITVGRAMMVLVFDHLLKVGKN
jgi:hypothetical protein